MLQKATPDELLLTVQMLQSELMHLKSGEQEYNTAPAVSIHMPVMFEQQADQTGQPIEKEEKIVQVLQIDEAEVGRRSWKK